MLYGILAYHTALSHPLERSEDKVNGVEFTQKTVFHQTGKTLHSEENKQELFLFLATKIISIPVPEGKALLTTSGKEVHVGGTFSSGLVLFYQKLS